MDKIEYIDITWLPSPQLVYVAFVHYLIMSPMIVFDVSPHPAFVQFAVNFVDQIDVHLSAPEFCLKECMQEKKYEICFTNC